MSGQLRGTGAILRRSQVEQEVGLKRSTIYSIRLGERAVGWRASDIELFLENPAGYRVLTSDDEVRDA